MSTGVTAASFARFYCSSISVVFDTSTTLLLLLFFDINMEKKEESYAIFSIKITLNSLHKCFLKNINFVLF